MTERSLSLALGIIGVAVMGIAIKFDTTWYIMGMCTAEVGILTFVHFRNKRKMVVNSQHE